MKGYLGEFEPPESHRFISYEPTEWAIEYLARYSYIDGAHHKQWVIDQIARILMGTPVLVKEKRWECGHREFRFNTGEPSQDYLDWRGEDFDEDEDSGIPP